MNEIEKPLKYSAHEMGDILVPMERLLADVSWKCVLHQENRTDSVRLAILLVLNRALIDAKTEFTPAEYLRDLDAIQSCRTLVSLRYTRAFKEDIENTFGDSEYLGYIVHLDAIFGRTYSDTPPLADLKDPPRLGDGRVRAAVEILKKTLETENLGIKALYDNLTQRLKEILKERQEDALAVTRRFNAVLIFE